MHEMSIAARVIDTAWKYVPTDSNTRLRRINLILGKLSGVSKSALCTCFEALVRGTPSEGAKLSIVEVPILVKCSQCGVKSEQEELPFLCASCGSLCNDIISGRELQIDSIEVESHSRCMPIHE